MTENRKVRKDFDATAEYSADVLGCTEEGKQAANLHAKALLGIV